MAKAAQKGNHSHHAEARRTRKCLDKGQAKMGTRTCLTNTDTLALEDWLALFEKRRDPFAVIVRAAGLTLQFALQLKLRIE